MQTTTTQRLPYTQSTAIQQRITAGNTFNGTFPTGDCPLANASGSPGPMIYKFGAQAAGGLFFWDTNEPVICGQFHIDVGSSADIKLYLVNLDPTTCKIGSTPTVLTGESILIEEQTGANYVALDEARFKTVLLPYQALQLIVSGATGTAMIAQAVGSIERTYVR